MARPLHLDRVLQGQHGGSPQATREPAGLLDLRVGVEAGGEQAAGVGLDGALEDLAHAAGLDDAALLHDHDVVGEVADHRQVVGDEDEGDAEVAAQVGEELDDLGLDRDVEGGDGLVGDDELGLQGEGAGDGDALALAAGELVRVALGVLGGEADLGEELGDAGAPLRLWERCRGG